MASEGGAGGREVGRISIRVVPNLDRFRSELQSRLDEIEKSVKCKVRIEPDMDHFREEVDAATRGLKDAKVKVKTEVDNSDDAVKQFAQRMKSFNKLKLKTELDKSSIERSIREANLLAHAADVKIKVRSESSGGSLLSGLFGGAASGASSGMGGLGAFGGQAALIGAAIIAFLAPALALLSTALVSLPALITAVALPLGVFAIGLGGIKKALEDSGILTDTKGKNGKDKIGLGTFLKQIQESVSNVFEKGLTPLFKQMFDAFSGNIPILSRGLPFIAQGIVNFATGVTRALSSVPNLQMMDRLTNSIGSMVTNLGPGITSFTNGMIRLTTDVGDHLPGLGTVLSGFADRFSNWVAKIDKPKKDWFNQDIAGSSTLDSAVSNMKPVLESVVNFVGRLTAAGLELAANPQMADNIKSVVDGLTNFITAGLPKLNEVFKGIADTMHLLGIDNPKSDHPNPPVNPAAPAADGRPIGTTPRSGVDPKTGQFTSDWNGAKAEFEAGQGPLGWLHKAQTGASKWLSENIDPKLLFADQKPRPGVQMMGPGQQQAPPPQQPQKAEQPKVDLNPVAQSIQSATGAIAGAANAAFKALVDAATVAVSQCVAAVQQLPGAIAQALAGVGPAGAAAGQALGTGMAGGIAASAPAAIAAATALAQGVEAAAKVHLGIKSPSTVFHEIGQNTAQGFQDGLEGGFQGVLDSAKGLSQKVSDAMKGGTQGIGPQFKDDISKQLSALDLERKQLKVQYDAATDKGEKKQLETQMKQLGAAGDQLRLQKDQLGYSDKYGDGIEKTDDKMQKMLGGSVNKMVDIGKNFAMANVNQFESDIGISGQGAIPTLANLGLNWGTQMLNGMVTNAFGGGQGKTEIHVNSVDEALAAKQTTDNRRALTHHAGR